MAFENIPMEEPGATWTQMRTRFHEIARILESGSNAQVSAAAQELYNIFSPDPKNDDNSISETSDHPKDYPIIGALGWLMEGLVDLEDSIKYSISMDGTHQGVLDACQSLRPVLSSVLSRLLASH